jgi:peptidase E
MTKRILATSGGFEAGPVQQSVRVAPMLLEALALTKQTRPRVGLVLTASGDDIRYYAMLYEAFNAAGCDVTELKLFPQPSADPTERLTSCDLIWVGGGSVANLLSLWRLHGVDIAMREAWEKGVILSGVSAGSICWHEGGPTDSFGQTLQTVDNGLAFLPYANGVHYNSEAQRRPLLQQLIRDQRFEQAYATDDYVGIWYEDTEVVGVRSDKEGAKAYHLTREGGEVIERELTIP